MRKFDGFRTGEVRDAAGDFKNSVIGPVRKSELADRLLQNLLAAIVQATETFDLLWCKYRIGESAPSHRQLACTDDPIADNGAFFFAAGRSVAEYLMGYPRYLNVHIDAIE